MNVFISYSSKDKNVADAVCHVLEENNITCWISPRDVQPGISYAKQLIHAIKNCQVFVLILSKESNVSEHVGNEVDCAFKASRPIIPFAIDDTQINEELDYYLSRKHWLVAYPDYKQKTSDLVLSVKRLLGSEVMEPIVHIPEEPAEMPKMASENKESGKKSYVTIHLKADKETRIFRDGIIAGVMAPQSTLKVPIEKDCKLKFVWRYGWLKVNIRQNIDTDVFLGFNGYCSHVSIAQEFNRDVIEKVFPEDFANIIRINKVFLIFLGCIIVLGVLCVIGLGLFGWNIYI